MSYTTRTSGEVGDLLYRLVLRVLPATFRASYADEILSYHRARMNETAGSNWERVRMWCRAIWDVLLNGMFERANQARQAAPRAFRTVNGKTPGGIGSQEPQWRRALHALQLWMWFDSIAARRLLKSPRFTIVTLLTLGLGIGANTALFSVVHSVLLNPLPYEDSERLVFAWETRGENNRLQSVSLANFEEWRNTSTGFQKMAAARYGAYNVTGFDRPFRINGLEVSAGLLSLLRTRPLHGREFSPEEEQPGADPVCLVSHSFWLERLGGDLDLANLRLTLNGTSHAVVGVLPAGLQIPGFGQRQILTSAPLDPNDIGYWSNHNTTVYGRLSAGVQIEQVGEELSLVVARLEEARPEWNEGIGALLVPAREQLVQGARRTLWILFGTVGFVLLIACANVASLLLARAAAAEREMAVRVALGAPRSRIVRLVLSEALLLSAGGGLLGLGLGFWGVEAIRRWGPANLPRLSEVEVSVPVLLFTGACAVTTGVLFGLFPALRSSRVDIQSTLNKSGRSPGLGASHSIQRALVVAEVAIAVVVLNCSGLLLRTFNNLLNVDPGFDSEGRVALQVTLTGARYSEHAQVIAFLDQLHEKLDAIPGVLKSGSSVGLPFQWMMWRSHMTLEGRPVATLPEVPLADVSISTPGYVETMDFELLSGRSISESDDTKSPFVAVVTEAFIRENLPGEDPIGRRLRLSLPDALLPADQSPDEFPWFTIVGVVEDVRRWNLTSETFPEVFVSQRQYEGAREFYVVVHTTLPVETVADPMRQAVWDVDPEQPVAWVQPIDAMFSDMVSQPRFNATLVGALGLTALILALIGVYGLMANTVSARTREIGVRVALGARPTQILNHVAAKGISAAVIGIVIGILVSAAASRVMETLLFGIQPIDLPTFMIVVTAVLLVATVAASVPSWRAARLDATVVLASE